MARIRNCRLLIGGSRLTESESNRLIGFCLLLIA